MDNLESRVAVVTGAASGIGLAAAREFGHERMRVVVSDVAAEPLKAAVAGLQAEGIDCIGIVTDVRDPDAVESLAQAAVDTYGQVNVLCNNAGVAVLGRQWELSAADWAFAVDICLWGVINGVRSFVPRMLSSGQSCHVVNVASMAGLISAPFLGPYTAAKHAVVGLSKSLRIELVGTNVGVTVVCPGAVRTNVAHAMRERRESESDREASDTDVFLDHMEAGLADEGSMSPEEVGRMLVRAIKNDQFWLLPNGSAQLPLVGMDLEDMRNADSSVAPH